MGDMHGWVDGYATGGVDGWPIPWVGGRSFVSFMFLPYPPCRSAFLRFSWVCCRCVHACRVPGDVGSVVVHPAPDSGGRPYSASRYVRV
jgi:hypothetical protein